MEYKSTRCLDKRTTPSAPLSSVAAFLSISHKSKDKLSTFTMAPEYTLNVNIGDKWRTQWAKVPEMKLCFATSVSGGGSQIYSNVVALTSGRSFSSIHVSSKSSKSIYR